MLVSLAAAELARRAHSEALCIEGFPAPWGLRRPRQGSALCRGRSRAPTSALWATGISVRSMLPVGPMQRRWHVETPIAVRRALQC